MALHINPEQPSERTGRNSTEALELLMRAFYNTPPEELDAALSSLPAIPSQLAGRAEWDERQIVQEYQPEGGDGEAESELESDGEPEQMPGAVPEHLTEEQLRRLLNEDGYGPDPNAKN